MTAVVLWAALMTFWAPPAQAHKASDSYLFIDSAAGQTTWRWDIALRDLETVLPMDADGDRALTWGEVRRAWAQVDALALSALQVPGCRLAVDAHALEQRNDGAYAVLSGQAACSVTTSTPVGYALFLGVDPTHRGLLRLRVDSGEPQLRMLAPAALPATSGAAVAVPVADAPVAPADTHAPAFIGEGVHHIVTGYDHLLFLLCLLLPAVLRREHGQWRAVASWRQAVLPVAKTVTLFTLAHSATLALAALGWVRLAPSFVEPAIAATIVLAAVDNLRPLLLRWRSAVTFGFGLVHGFGFAGVLGEMDLPPAQFGWALFQFNLGLELGQLVLVLLVVPLLFALRQSRNYVPLVLRAGSTLAGLMALVWLVERTTEWRLIS